MKDLMYKKISSCLADPSRPFIPGGKTVGEISALAAGIRKMAENFQIKRLMDLANSIS